MTALRIVPVLAFTLAIAAFAVSGHAFALSEAGPAIDALYTAQQTENGGRDVTTPVIWTLVVIAGASLLMGMLYLLKRRVGGFPENPTWVAPITIMPASENPTDETFGEAPAHDTHGSPH